MAPQGPSPRCIQFSGWRDNYQAALKETNTFALFTCVEIAEAALMTRRSALQRSCGDHRSGDHPLGDHSSGDQAERREIEEALENLRVLKRDRLRFDDGRRPVVSWTT